MSYICQNCHLQQPPKTPQHTLVTETRKVEYEVVRDRVTSTEVGFEIAREIRVCPKCRIILTPKVEVGAKPVISQSELKKVLRSQRKSKLLDEEDEDEGLD